MSARDSAHADGIAIPLDLLLTSSAMDVTRRLLPNTARSTFFLQFFVSSGAAPHGRHRPSTESATGTRPNSSSATRANMSSRLSFDRVGCAIVVPPKVRPVRVEDLRCHPRRTVLIASRRIDVAEGRLSAVFRLPETNCVPERLARTSDTAAEPIRRRAGRRRFAGRGWLPRSGCGTSRCSDERIVPARRPCNWTRNPGISARCLAKSRLVRGVGGKTPSTSFTHAPGMLNVVAQQRRR